MKKLLLLLLLIGTALVSAKMIDLGDGTFYDDKTGGYYRDLEGKEKIELNKPMEIKLTEQQIIYKIDTKYPIEYYNASCFKTLKADTTELSKLSLSIDDAKTLQKGELPYTLTRDYPIKVSFNYSQENILCHWKMEGVYKWGFNSSIVVVANISLGVYNNTYRNATDNTLRTNITLGNGSYISQVIQRNQSQDINMLNVTLNSYSWSGYEVQGSVRTNNATYILSYFSNDVILTSSDGTITNWIYSTDIPYTIPGSCYAIINTKLFFNGSCEATNNHIVVIDLNTTTFQKPFFNYSHIMMKVKVMQNNKDNYANSEDNRIGISFHQTKGPSQSDGWAFLWTGGPRGLSLLEENTAWKVTTSTNNITKGDWWWMKVVWNGTYASGKSWKEGTVEPSTWNVSTASFGTADLSKIMGGFMCGKGVECYFDDLAFCNMETSDCGDWNSWQTYQSFSSGQATKNYSVTNDTSFYQVKLNMFSDTSSQNIVYALNTTEWNYTYSGSEADTTAPTVTLNFPGINYYNDTLQFTNFNCTATDASKVVNISLYLSNALNQSYVFNATNTSTMPLNTFNISYNLSNGNYTWNCYACDNSSNCGFAANRTILMNYTAPVPIKFIQGYVKDSSGLTISNASVFLILNNTNTTIMNTSTNANGYYNFTNILAGIYSVFGYKPTNHTLGADMRSFISVP